jgi:putative alpha-1,2-mannosidase
VTIRAPGNSDARRYVNTLRIDGKAASRNWIGHEELMRGARLDFEMSATPNRRRGTREEDAPYSFSLNPAERQPRVRGQ